MTRIGKGALLAACLAAVFAVGVVDFITGALPDLTILYFVPITVAAVYVGLRSAYAVVALTFLVEVVPPLVVGDRQANIIFFDGVMHLLVRGLGVYAIGRVLRQLREIRELKDERDFDLELAARAQQSLFPPPPARSDVAIGLRAEFLREVGGDFYHFAETPWGLFLCIGDISGKGMSAALFTAALERAVSEVVRTVSDVGGVLEAVNARLVETLPEDRFVTFLACVVSESHLEYANAGHEPALLYRRTDGSVQVLDTDASVPLGIMPRLEATSVRIELSPGDVLLLTTDGVTESEPFFGHAEERLSRLLAESARDGAQQVADVVIEAVHEGGAQPKDDMVVLTLERLG